MDRNELLRDRIRENKDPQTTLVSTWHPKLSAIPSILKHNFQLISSNLKLSKIFKQKPNVTYQKNKSLSDHLLKNNIANQQLHSNITRCGKRKLCPQINTAKLITNDNLNITEKIKGTGNCKDREIIYAAHCFKDRVLYIGHTGEQLSQCFCNLNNDINVTILQKNIKTAATRRYHKDEWICKLKNLTPHGLKTEIGDYTKEMYTFY